MIVNTAQVPPSHQYGGGWWWWNILSASPPVEIATQLQCSCLENPRDGGAWWAAVYGVAQSWTGLKRLSSNPPVWGFLRLYPLYFLGSWGLGITLSVSTWERCCRLCLVIGEGAGTAIRSSYFSKWFSVTVFKPAASTPPGNLPEMQFFGPCPRWTESETLGCGSIYTSTCSSSGLAEYPS